MQKTGLVDLTSELMAMQVNELADLHVQCVLPQLTAPTLAPKTREER
jgi:hypothetical protein